jgi:dipeptidyl aminopeptidase/acylaminoacyl peptidase
VAHEAVIRAWETLRGWIAEDREALMVRQELGRGAAPWALGGRLADDLWSGGRLKRAAELRDAGKLRLFGEEAAFLDASEAAQRAQVEAVEAARRAELARERAARRRGRVVAIVALAGALVMAGLGGWARNEQGKAAVAEREARSSAAQEKTQKELARQSSLLAGARELLAQRQPAWAKGLLLEVQGAGDRSDWIDVALDALDERAPRFTYAGHASGVNLAAWSPDGRRVLTASEDRTAWVWSADGKGPRVRLAGHRGALYHAAWSPDGQRLATASEDRTARIWSADGTGAPLCLVATRTP